MLKPGIITTVPDVGIIASSLQCSIQSKLFVHRGLDVKVFNLGSGREESTIKDIGKVSLRFPGRKIIGFCGDIICFYDFETSKSLVTEALKFEKSVDISLMHVTYDLGMLFLAGKVKDSREGIILCL